ncbi:MAG: hypothetical protein KBF82_02540 [Chitinophagaceae bacterium]|nr:hypothetical protein [Chitinophagaceae bacterium]
MQFKIMVNYKSLYLLLIAVSSLLMFPLKASSQFKCHNQFRITNPKLKNILINSNGIERSFLVYIPAGYKAGRQGKVVFMFHGASQDGMKMFNKTEWSQKADTEKFLVIFPNSLCYFSLDDQAVKSRWNDGNLKLKKHVTAADDVLFFNDMVQWVNRYRDSLAKFETTPNPTKIFISGFSNGAFFCSKLMMEAADKITAAGVVSTFMPATTITQPAQPVPSIIIYGTNDQHLLDTLHINAPQFPSTPNSFVATPLFNQLITWHLQRNQLNSTFTQQATNSKYKLIYNQPNNGQANNRKYFEIQVYRGLTHIYPVNNTVNATDIFNQFFNSY